MSCGNFNESVLCTMAMIFEPPPIPLALRVSVPSRCVEPCTYGVFERGTRDATWLGSVKTTGDQFSLSATLTFLCRMVREY